MIWHDFFFLFLPLTHPKWHEDLIFERVKSAWHIYNKQLASESAANLQLASRGEDGRWAGHLPGPHVLVCTRPRALCGPLLLLTHFPIVFSPRLSIFWKWELEFEQ